MSVRKYLKYILYNIIQLAIIISFERRGQILNYYIMIKYSTENV